MTKRAVRRWWLVGLGAGSALAGSPAAAQDVGTVRGVVLEYGTRRPVSGVRVTVLGTNIVAVTDHRGRYEVSVPAGKDLVLRAHRLEYAAVVERAVPVPAGVLVVNFTLATRALVLEALEIRGGDSAAVQSGVISESELDRRGERPLGEVLDGVSGVQLIRPSGQVGRGYQLRIRGARSFSFPSTPLVFVDGVAVDVAGTRGGAGILELLDPFTIGRVEVLRGPAAAVRYGTGAMNGVILITTKRGPGGPPQDPQADATAEGVSKG